MEKNNNEIRIGLVGTSVSHFPVETAKKNLNRIASAIPVSKESIIGPYLVIETKDSEKVAKELQSQDICLLVIFEGAFTWDNIICRIVQELSNIPIVIWALPEPPMEGGKLTTNSLCGAIMNNAALMKLGRKTNVIYGEPDSKDVIYKLDSYIRAAITVKKLRSSKFCLVGYRPIGFYNCSFDEIFVRKIFGVEIVHMSLLDLVEESLKIPDNKVTEEVNNIKSKWNIGEATEEDLYNTVKFRKYLLDYSKSNGINSYGIKCWPELPKRGLNPCFLIGLLNDEGIITGAEADFNGTLTMLIEHYLTDDKIPYLTDLIKTDEETNTCVFWHCGCAAPSLAAGDKQKCTDCKSNSSNENSNVKESSNNISSRVTIQKQFRGLDRGPAAEFPLKEGRLTVARLDNRDGKYQMFITEGEALPTEMILRGTPSIVRMDAPVNRILKAIIENGVSHHYTIVYGSHKEKLIEFCRLLNIEVICPEIM